MNVLAILLGLTSMFALGAMVMDGDVQDEEDEAPEERDPEIDLTDQERDPDIDPADHVFETSRGGVIVGDTLYSPQNEEVVIDMTDFDVETGQIAVVARKWGPESLQIDPGTVDFSTTENGDVVLHMSRNSFVFTGLKHIPEGLMDIHIVDISYHENTGWVVDQIYDSFEDVTYETEDDAGGATVLSGDVGGLDVLDCGEGSDQVAVSGAQTLWTRTGGGDDTIDLSGETAVPDTASTGVGEYTDGEYIFTYRDEDGGVHFDHDFHQIETGDGDDTVILGTRNAELLTGDGNDSITATQSVGLYLDAGSGDDIIDLSAVTTDSNGAVIIGGMGSDTFLGGEGHDTYFGIAGGEYTGDSISGGGSRDALYGGGGADRIDGGEGDDTIGGYRSFVEYSPTGGSGFPSIDETDFQDGSADTLEGGAGDDLLRGDAWDSMTGGDGADEFRIYSGLGYAESGAHATVTDFNPAEDHLLVTIHYDDIETTPSHWHDDEHWEAGIKPDLIEVGGDTHVMFEGETLIVLKNITGVPASAIRGEVFMPYNRW